MLGLLTTICILNIIVQVVGLIIGRGLFPPLILGTMLNILWIVIIASEKESD